MILNNTSVYKGVGYVFSKMHYDFLGKGPLSSVVVEPFQNPSLCDITVPPTSGLNAPMNAFQPTERVQIVTSQRYRFLD